jgi:hypothetical protein
MDGRENLQRHFAITRTYALARLLLVEVLQVEVHRLLH